ncbi:4,5-DOPA dioxygenase extradiol [Membranihabitans maritimus]|uniref:4,5-DOPA-extradiol-dioxygenase n=1 Tax=Membranihabitans maritimus TaxID=2904244 RepID=UPI001F46D543|nr:4,5-DOPA dioxygenase extradiol [Membranihabitans maritimus]
MTRKEFLYLSGVTTTSIPVVNSLQSIQKITDSYKITERMPVLFLGHGSPMNGIEDNEFVREFKSQVAKLEKPNAIIVVSAHWETKGTKVTAMDNPRTIHDFGGFPKALYEVQYPAPGSPAPGSPALAGEISNIVQPTGTVELDHNWGLDHGAWTVVKHLFPNADVPVIQLSLDVSLSPMQHYELAKQLKSLRDKGILIIGSGNIVHNLGMIAWNKLNQNYGYDWAIEANSKMKKWILDGDHKSLIEYKKQGKAFELAVPTPEHYLPLLYTMGLKQQGDNPIIFNNKSLGGSLTMTSVKLG